VTCNNSYIQLFTTFLQYLNNTLRLTFRFRWHGWRSGTGRIFRRNLFCPTSWHKTATLFHPVRKQIRSNVMNIY